MSLNVLYGNILNTAIANALTFVNGVAAEPLFAERFQLGFGTSISSEALGLG